MEDLIKVSDQENILQAQLSKMRRRSRLLNMFKLFWESFIFTLFLVWQIHRYVGSGAAEDVYDVCFPQYSNVLPVVREKWCCTLESLHDRPRSEIS